MRVPTYLQKENYKIVKEEEDFLTVTIMNEGENGRYNEFFEIYYFGELFLDTMICGIFDDKTCKTVPCKIIAKCIKTGKEILLFDEAKYGYDPLFCDEFDGYGVKKNSYQA